MKKSKVLDWSNTDTEEQRKLRESIQFESLSIRQRKNYLRKSIIFINSQKANNLK